MKTAGGGAEAPERLVEAYFDGSLSPDGEERLRGWLESDPTHMDEFLEQLEVHVSLWEKLTPVAGEEPAAAPEHASRAAALRTAVARRRPARRPGLPAWVRWGLAPVAAAAALLLAVHLFSLRDRERVRAELCAEIVEVAGSAETIRAAATVPAAGGQRLMPGDGLRTGVGG